MNSRRSIRIVTALIGLTVALGATLYVADFVWRRFIPAPYAYSDQPLVDRALDIYGGGTRSRKELLRKVYPVVVRLPEMTCVGLNPRPGRMASATTICFRDSDGTVVLTHDS